MSFEINTATQNDHVRFRLATMFMKRKIVSPVLGQEVGVWNWKLEVGNSKLENPNSRLEAGLFSGPLALNCDVGEGRGQAKRGRRKKER